MLYDETTQNDELGHFESALAERGIPVDKWTGENGTKTVEDLYSEVMKKESRILLDEKGELYRATFAVSGEITYDSKKQGKSFRLRNSNQPTSTATMVEAITIDADPRKTITKSISKDLGDAGKYLTSGQGALQVTTSETPAYPGLVTRTYINKLPFKMEVQQYKKAGYMAADADHTPYVWEEVPTLPLVLSESSESITAALSQKDVWNMAYLFRDINDKKDKVKIPGTDIVITEGYLVDRQHNLVYKTGLSGELPVIPPNPNSYSDEKFDPKAPKLIGIYAIPEFAPAKPLGAEPDFLGTGGASGRITGGILYEYDDASLAFAPENNVSSMESAYLSVPCAATVKNNPNLKLETRTDPNIRQPDFRTITLRNARQAFEHNRRYQFPGITIGDQPDTVENIIKIIELSY